MGFANDVHCLLQNRFRIVAQTLLLLAVLVLPVAALAQADGSIVGTQKAVVGQIAGKADQLAARLQEKAEDDAALVEIRVQLEQLARDLLSSGVAFRPRLTEINDRLEQLGPAPAAGEPPEPEAVAAERRRLMDEKGEINALIGEAETLSLKVNRMIETIAQMRRDLFTTTLSRRYDLTIALSPAVAQEFQADIATAYKTVGSWFGFVTRFKLRSFLLAMFISVAASLALLAAGQRLFGNLIRPDPTEEEPSYLSRLSVALWSTLLPSAALALLLMSSYFLLDTFKVLRGDIGQLLWTLFTVTIIVFFVFRLMRAALAPRMPGWRLLPVESHAAARLCWLGGAMAVVTAIDFFMNRFYTVFGSQLSLTVATSLIATLIVGILLILIGLVRPFAAEEGAEAARPRPWPLPFRLLLYALGVATIVAAVLGYVGFASFLSQQVVVTGAILATMCIGFFTAGAIASEGAFAKSRLGRRLEGRSGFDATTLDQLGLAIGIFTNILVVLVGAPLILMQWGFYWADLTAWTYGIASEIRIGSFSFSIIGILSGILVFVIGYFVTRWFQSWLDSSVMSRSRVDTGVRNSIRTAVGYAGVAIAALIGISAAGINLSSLALVAGALSLGIGFGLQNIVSNFVSGLILLVERPFKAGDWIVAGAVSGTVKKISVRATEIETFQRQTVILPNSELINAAVGNWTHKNRLGRVDIPVGVAYGSDVKRVHEILLQITRDSPLVLKNPEPFVLFAGFGDSSLDFEIRVFLSDILTQLQVQNDIRFAIVEAFENEGIEIPFPQRDVYLRGGALQYRGGAFHLARDQEDGQAKESPAG